MNEALDFRIRYRPVRFEQFWGNSHIKDIVRRWTKSSFPRSIVLAGDYGIGKTTLARIIANRILCRQQSRGEIESCGYCFNCTRDMDGTKGYFEINSVKCGFEHVQAYLQGTLFVHTALVFFFDEMQRMVPKAQELLLKPIEDTIDTHFIFATTDKDKLDYGIISRSSILRLKNPSEEECLNRALCIARENKIIISHELLKSLIRHCHFNPREIVGKLSDLRGFDRNISINDIKELFDLTD